MAKPTEAENPQEPRFSQEQYDLLKRCSDKQDITEWNDWRKRNPCAAVELDGADLSSMALDGILLCEGTCLDPSTNVLLALSRPVCLRHAKMWGTRLCEANLQGAHLEGALLQRAHLREARLHEAHLQGAKLHGVHLERASLRFADLQDADLWLAHLEGADLTGRVDMQGTDFLGASTDQSTILWKPKVSRYTRNGRFTGFSGVSVDSLRTDPGTEQLLEYNIRRKNWEGWYKGHRFLRWPVQLFWLASDYGLSTGRVLVSFAVLALVFAVVYWLSPGCVMVYGKVGDIRGFVHALYFSVVTMTTLGFGDIAANPESACGELLLMLQVILGYVLLGALVTRFAVLFTAGGPAGKFADERRKETK